MKTFIENLHDHNVIFSYYGFIDNSVLTEVLQITKSKLQGNNEPPIIVERVHDAINNCVDNIIKHNFYPDDERVHYKSLLVVSKKEDHFLIDTINVINASQKEMLNQQLTYLHSHTKDELRKMRDNSIVNNQVRLGAGLVDLVLQADNCDCTFKDIENNFLFNINFRINSAN